jgi:hypothetical protein
VAEYGGALKQNLGALVTFFITVIIVKSVATSGNGAIFDREITGLAYAAVACSGIYLGVMLVLFNLELTRVSEKHDRIKSRYKDLLDAKDLDNIFEDNRDLKAIIHDMEKRRNAVTIAWLLILVAVGILTWRLGTLKQVVATAPPPAAAVSPQAAAAAPVPVPPPNTPVAPTAAKSAPAQAPAGP